MVRTKRLRGHNDLMKVALHQLCDDIAEEGSKSRKKNRHTHTESAPSVLKPWL